MSVRPTVFITAALILGAACGAFAQPEAWVDVPPLERRELAAPSPSAAQDTRSIHVSSSAGSDQNSGLSPESPVKTVARGKSLVRDQTPDRLLLKRGDVWDEPLGRWKARGRSAREPVVVGSYGAGARPLLRTGAKRGVFTNAGGGTPKQLDYVVISGLHFFAHTRDPKAANHSTEGAEGLQWLSGTRGVVIDDCVFQSYATGMTFITHGKRRVTNIVVQRCLIVDSYGVGSHSQGIYVDGVDGFTLQASVLDHNGWNEAVKGAHPTIYNHNVYVQSNCTNVSLIQNAILRGASHGVQLRPGGVVQENLFARNAIALLIGGGDDPVPGGVTAVASGNVIVEGRDITESLPRGWGVDLAKNAKRVTLENTLVANVLVQGGNTRAMKDNASATHVNTVVRAWPGGQRFESAQPWVDARRSLATYMGAVSFDAFAARLREHAGVKPGAYGTWALINWLREGFRPQ